MSPTAVSDLTQPPRREHTGAALVDGAALAAAGLAQAAVLLAGPALAQGRRVLRGRPD